MSYYDDASLVVIPSAQKTSKLYAVKPTDGSGDLAFTRTGDTATRVNSAGLIERVRTNLYPRGSALLATGWTSVGATLTAGQTDPTGGTTALRVQLAAAQSPYAYILQSLTGSAATYARSVYIKGATAQTIRIIDPFSGLGSTINLTTSYQRFTAVGAGTAPSFGIQFDNQNDDAAKDFIIAFVQIEEGDIATTYIPTTTAAVSVGPVANVPRLDYLNSSCPRLLLEPQRTNLTFNSETIDASTGSTVSLNNAASPDGYVNADKLVEDTSTGLHQAAFTTSLGGSVDSSVYSVSIFAKAAGRSRILILDNNQDTSGATTFDLSSGTIVSGGGKIEDYGSGWYRCTIFPIKNFSTTSSVIIRLISTGTTTSYTGDGTSGALLWGKQVEAGAYATSYIPTLAASATRGADACSKTGISSLIGQTEGTMFAEFNVPSLASAGSYTALNISDGTSSNIIDFAYYPTGRIQAAVLVGGSVTVNIDFPSYGLTAGTHKVAFAYKLNDYVLFVDGVLRGSDTSSAVPATSKFDLYAGSGSTQVYSQALLFKTRLTNAELAELTTL